MLHHLTGLLIMLPVALAISLAMAFAWLVQFRTRNASWVDAIWTFSSGIGGAAYAVLAGLLVPQAPVGRRLAIAAIALAWSARLGFFIVARARKGHEDPRYTALRDQWGTRYEGRMFAFLQLQALIAWLLALTVFFAAANPVDHIRLLDIAGLVVLLVAVTGETSADRQLRRFRENPGNKGLICDTGLWSWSRHPNYFFEWLGWIGYLLFAVNLTGAWPWGWGAVIGPVMMYWLLVYVSGVPPVEAAMAKSRGPAFAAYRARVSPFFPWPPGPDRNPGMTLGETAGRLAESLPVPDSLTRLGIAMMVGRTRRELAASPVGAEGQFATWMRGSSIARNTQEANDQHYELPPAFFAKCLGPRRKYSCCLYETGRESLAQAEDAALAETVAHARLQDGQDILELGCGWGSLSLYMAQLYPASRITAVSNSAPQRAAIEAMAQSRAITNLRVITADMNDFTIDQRFDRVVSVEMFEHMTNWPALLGRIRGWLRADGRLFLHVFTHDSVPYPFDQGDKSDWIAQYFFTGGIMPSHGLLRHFPELFTIERDWRWNGRHYERTALDWLANYDRAAADIRPILREVYGDAAPLWFRRWRIFFLATAGLFGNAGGEAWGVSHYLLK